MRVFGSSLPGVGTADPINCGGDGFLGLGTSKKAAGSSPVNMRKVVGNEVRKVSRDRWMVESLLGHRRTFAVVLRA